LFTSVKAFSLQVQSVFCAYGKVFETHKNNFLSVSLRVGHTSGRWLLAFHFHFHENC